MKTRVLSKACFPCSLRGSLWVFDGLYGSLALLSLCQSFTIAEGLSGSLRVFSFVFAEDLSGSLEYNLFLSQRPSATQSFWVFLGR